jgi:nucleotide-binding universal stress UspA family protein
MIEIRRILCPIDLSDHSRGALDHAVAIARWYQAKVTVLHVSPAPIAAYAAGPVVLEPMVSSAADREHLLAEVKAFVAAESAPRVVIETMLCEGNPATEILDQAGSTEADLLVIGTHGRSGFERLLLGSVAEKVLRKANCPVLTVPKRIADIAPARQVLYKRILCSVDFSDSSMHALKYATSLAQETDADLVVLHVVAHEFDHAAETAVGAYDAGMSVADFLKTREAELCRRLQEAVSQANEFCSVKPVIAHGKPWREILRVAAQRESDVIVMGVQGRGATDLLFFGSTTQQVVRESPCPVLTLRRG